MSPVLWAVQHPIWSPPGDQGPQHHLLCPAGQTKVQCRRLCRQRPEGKRLNKRIDFLYCESLNYYLTRFRLSCTAHTSWQTRRLAGMRTGAGSSMRCSTCSESCTRRWGLTGTTTSTYWPGTSSQPSDRSTLCVRSVMTTGSRTTAPQSCTTGLRHSPPASGPWVPSQKNVISDGSEQLLMVAEPLRTIGYYWGESAGTCVVLKRPPGDCVVDGAWSLTINSKWSLIRARPGHNL